VDVLWRAFAVKILPILLLLLLACGCRPQTTASIVEDPERRLQAVEHIVDLLQKFQDRSEAKTAALLDENFALTNRVSLLEKQIEILGNHQWVNSEKLLSLTQRDNQDYQLNLNDKTFSVVTSRIGPVLVRTESVQAHLDGYTLKLQIGNPYYADFKSTKVTARWPQNARTNSAASFETLEITASPTIQAGKWTELEFSISPLDATQLRDCRLSFSFPTVSLLK